MGPTDKWNSRGHYFAAAAEAMRRIIVESARRKPSQKYGGDMSRFDLDDVEAAATQNPVQLLKIDDGLSELERLDSEAGKLFELRYFTGCSVEKCGEILGISRAAAYRHWTFARAWILKQLLPND